MNKKYIMYLMAAILIAGCSQNTPDAELFYEALTKQTVEAQMRANADKPKSEPSPTSIFSAPILITSTGIPKSKSVEIITPVTVKKYEKLTGRHVNIKIPVMSKIIATPIYTVEVIPSTAVATATAVVAEVAHSVKTTPCCMGIPLHSAGWITKGMVFAVIFGILLFAFIIGTMPRIVEGIYTKLNKWMNR
jgi:uncharacterized membrane protein YczE